MLSMCRVVSCVWNRVFAMTSVVSWQNSVSLCPASFCTPRSNLPVTPDISWLPTLAFQSPIMKRTPFLAASSRRSYRSSQNHSTSGYSAFLVGAQTWITIILNGLPWKRTEIILIPKMLMFTLAISCLTTFNLPWLMDLTCQAPMQYRSL